MRSGFLLVRAWTGLCLAFLAAPILVVILSSFSSSGYLRFPPQDFSLRWYSEFLSSPVWLKPLGVSVILALGVALLTTTISVLAAAAVVRGASKQRHVLSSLVMAPLVFPHAAIGVALLGMLALLGWVGTYQGIFLAHAVLCLPFAYRPIIAAMRGFDSSLEEAAMSLGAPPAFVVRHVTLPVLRSAIVTSLIFTFVISFDEVTVTAFLIGPQVSTLPTQIFTTIQESGSPVVAAVSSFLVLLTVGVVLLLDRVIGLQFFSEIERSR
jgi:putative spermidine/putrescine transport system permease protein